MVKTPLHVAIRVSTNPKHGAGHIARQLAVRKYLNGKVSWFTDPHGTGHLRGLLPLQDELFEEEEAERIDGVLRWTDTHQTGILLCDSYNITPHIFETVSQRVFFFCDYSQGQVSENVILVNAQPTAGFSDRHLFGPTFFAIDTRGKAQQNFDFSELTMPVNCLISFGSVDSNNMTGKALAAILDDPSLRRWIRPVCLLGSHFRYRDTVQEQLSAFPTAKIFDGMNSLLDLPVPCPIAVGAPGISHAERLYMGIATVLIPQNPYHQELCEAWEELGCGLYTTATSEHILRCLQNLIDNKFHTAQTISIRGQSFMNGKGAAKIAAKIARSTHDG